MLNWKFNKSFFNPPGHGSVDDLLDAENKRMAENLATKVSRLKSVSPNRQQLSRSSTNNDPNSRQTLSLLFSLWFDLRKLEYLFTVTNVSYTAGVRHRQRGWGSERVSGRHGEPNINTFSLLLLIILHNSKINIWILVCSFALISNTHQFVMKIIASYLHLDSNVVNVLA